jgi:HEAT repeat protein
VRQAAAYSIGRSFTEADRLVVERALVESARAPEAAVREAALWSLGSLGGPLAERTLRAALRAPEPGVRRTAAERPGEMESAESVPELTRMLGDRREPAEVRQAAAAALGQIGDARAAEPLLAALKDDNAYVRGAADSALQLLKGPPGARFVERLRDPAPRVRAEAAMKLGQSGDSTNVPRLVKLLADDDESVRQAAVRALGTFRDPAAERQLGAALAEADFRIRQGAVAALALGGRPAARATLTPLLKDPVGSVRAETVRALGRLGAGDQPPVLAAITDDDAAVRLALAETLAPLTSPAARDALLRLARDPAVQVRQVAVSALGRTAR